MKTKNQTELGTPTVIDRRYRLTTVIDRRYRLLLLVGLVLGTGCAMVSGTRSPDGALTITSWRVLWKSEAVNFSTSDTNKFKASLQVGQSATDADALANVTAAAVRAALKTP